MCWRLYTRYGHEVWQLYSVMVRIPKLRCLSKEHYVTNQNEIHKYELIFGFELRTLRANRQSDPPI